MAVVDRLILRLAVHEFLHVPSTPPKVVINEAVELARTFSTDDAPRSSMASWTASGRSSRRQTDAGKPSNDTQRESDQLAQRRANFEELVRLGVDPYPHRFDRNRHRAGARRGARRTKTATELEAERPETTTAGRVLAIRSFGKANFLVISDGRANIQVYVRQDSLPGARLQDLQAARLRRLGWRLGARCSGPRRTS